MADEIFGNMLCVDLTINTWTAQRKDKGVTLKVASDNNASRRAGKYVKFLVDPGKLSPIVSTAQQLRVVHKNMTLPWNDGGQRVITAEAFFNRYKPEMERLKDKYNQHVEEFLDNYATTVEHEVTRLGGMYDITEYPTINELRNKFGVSIVLSPVYTADDFRVDSVKYNVEQLKEEWDRTVRDRIEASVLDLYNKMIESLDVVAEYKNKQRIHESTMVNALNTARLIKDLDNWDTEATKLADRVLETFSIQDVDRARDSEGYKEEVSKKASALIEDIKKAQSSQNLNLDDSPSASTYEDLVNKMGAVYGVANEDQ